MSEAFVGTWRLVSYLVVDADGSMRPYWGARPIGQLVYTADGYMSAQVYDPRRRELGSDVESASAESMQSLYLGMGAYFGTYRIDADAKSVTHTVHGAWLPDWIGSHQQRSYRFIGDDQLELSVPGYALLWQRVGDHD